VLCHADAEQHAVAGRGGRARVDVGVCVAEEDGAVGGVVVDVPPAVGVLEVRAAAAPEAERRAAPAAARVDAAGDDLGGLREQGLGSRRCR
jgi:hypothetical protein